jgi:pantoate--beta-alanine ligase
MQVLSTRQDIRQWRRSESGVVGLVPTMGALHAGHLSLVETAMQESDRVCVSIFVNPAQFGDENDFASYPRTLDQDLKILQDAGVDAAFVPDAREIYPCEPRTGIHVSGLSQQLEGASRPGHFDGVCLVVNKLFNLVQPDQAYFGWKDAQQVRVLQQMVHDLDIPVDLRPRPTVRDADGLALSSRNQRLSASGREAATRIPDALFAIEEQFDAGERAAARLQQSAVACLQQEDRLTIDYVQIVDLQTLMPIGCVDRPSLVLIAAVCDEVRLIDSLLIDPGDVEATS